MAVALLTLFVTVPLSGCGPAARESANAAKTSTDDIARLLGQPTRHLDLETRISELDDHLRQVPTGAPLSTAAQVDLDAAVRISAELKRLRVAWTESDRVLAEIVEDSEDLLSTHLTVVPRPDFRAHMEDQIQQVGKEIVCTVFAEGMTAAQEESVRHQYAVTESVLGQPAPEDVVTMFRASVTDVGYQLEEVDEALDLYGLSSELLTQAIDSVGKVEDVMGAAEWGNHGAFQMYLRHCVL
ncbi:hypothetical protein AB0K08_11460 [Citricoccus sp. NPDC055426]|uniref:hypothetical protein n=1 Tax=Citricoccus sp. NPDC055426 TaxID=3155536 RepID=UPI00343782AB